MEPYMRRLLLGGLALLFLVSSVGAATAPAFPFRTYSDLSVTSPSVPVCENGGEMTQLGPEWRVLSWVDRDLFIHFDSTGTPDWVYLTLGQAEGEISVKHVLHIDEAKRIYPTGCEYGDDKDA